MFNKDRTTSLLIIINIVLAALVGILLQPYSTGPGTPVAALPAPGQVDEHDFEAWVAPTKGPIPPVRICLDPGHSIGMGNGNKAFFGETESEIVWIITSLLETRLREMGYEVIKTRTDPHAEMSLPDRSAVANNFNADLFLSLHCDLGGFSGYAFYVPDVPGQNEEKTGPPEEVRLRSRELAEQLDREIGRVGPIYSNGVKSEELTYAGGKQGALTISIHAEVPIMTLEMGFLDNENDGPFLASAAGKILWVQALASAIEKVLPTE